MTTAIHKDTTWVRMLPQADKVVTEFLRCGEIRQPIIKTCSTPIGYALVLDVSTMLQDDTNFIGAQHSVTSHIEPLQLANVVDKEAHRCYNKTIGDKNDNYHRH